MNKKVAIILGSTRPTRICPEIGDWCQRILNNGPINYEMVDLKKINLPFLDESAMPMSGIYHQRHTKEWSRLIKSYDGIIFLFPQYNWGYPAVLKNAIDYLDQEWNRKPVSCITYGFHGGVQGYLSMILVMKCIKMRQISVNPKLSINKNMFDNEHHFININRDFEPYRRNLQLLKLNFESVLKVGEN